MDKLNRNSVPLSGARDDKLDELVDQVNGIVKRLESLERKVKVPKKK